MKVLLVVFLLGLGILVVACGDDDATPTPDPKTVLCNELEELDTDVKALQALGPDATTAELEDAVQTVRLQVINVGQAAEPIKTARLETMESTWAALESAYRAVPPGTPLPETLAAIQPQAQQFLTEVLSLHEQEGCP